MNKPLDWVAFYVLHDTPVERKVAMADLNAGCSMLKDGDAAERAKAMRLNSEDSRHDPPGYYLFHQAIRQGSSEAWQQIYYLYSPLVCKWVVAHPSFANTGEEVDYFMNRAFEKLWRALTPEKFNNFLEFKALMAYLK